MMLKKYLSRRVSCLLQNDVVCRSCGVVGEYEERPHEIHGAGIYCTACGAFIKWKGKGNNKNKRNKNSKHRDKHKKDGPMVCAWCGIHEDETEMHFEIDHIIPIEDGGPDVFENTRPLCSACHWLRNAELHRVKYIRRHGKQFGEVLT